MTIERALELLPQMRDSEWITALGKKTALYTDEAKEAFNLAISALEKQEQDRWIPVTERLPEKEGWYITTVENEKTGKRRIENDLFAIDIAVAHDHTPRKFCKDGYRQKTIAWRPFPKPYTEEES